MFSNGHKMTWKNNKTSLHTSWKDAYLDLRDRLEAEAVDMHIIDMAEEVLDKHTKVKEGARVWRSGWQKLLPEDLRKEE